MTTTHEEQQDERTARKLSLGERTRLWSRRVGLWRLVLAATIALFVGVGLGRVSSPAGHDEARRVLEVTVVPLALDADTLWTASADDRASVAQGLMALRRDGDPSVIQANADEWLRAYDSVLVRITGVQLPAEARPVQRQFIASVTLSRDAVEVLAHAATLDDAKARQVLTSEVVRLRQRAEHLGAVARSALRDLEGPGGDVTRLPVLPGFDDLQ